MALGNLEVGIPKQITASGNIKSGQGAMLGILCSASTAVTVAIYDDASTGTTTKLVDTVTLTAGQYLMMPLTFANGLNIVVGGTLSATVIYV